MRGGIAVGSFMQKTLTVEKKHGYSVLLRTFSRSLIAFINTPSKCRDFRWKRSLRMKLYENWGLCMGPLSFVKKYRLTTISGGYSRESTLFCIYWVGYWQFLPTLSEIELGGFLFCSVMLQRGADQFVEYNPPPFSIKF